MRDIAHRRYGGRRRRQRQGVAGWGRAAASTKALLPVPRRRVVRPRQLTEWPLRQPSPDVMFGRAVGQHYIRDG